VPLAPLTPAETDVYVQQLLDAYRIAELRIIVALTAKGGRLLDWPETFAKRQLEAIQKAMGALRSAQEIWFRRILPAVYEHGLAAVDTQMMLPSDYRAYMAMRQRGIPHLACVAEINRVRQPPSTEEYQALVAKGRPAEKVLADLRQTHPGAVFGTNRLHGEQAPALPAMDREPARLPPSWGPRIVTPNDADFRQIHQRTLNNLSRARSHPLDSQVYRVEQTWSWKQAYREENLRIVQDALSKGQNSHQITKRLLEHYEGRTLTSQEATQFRRALMNRKVAPAPEVLDALKESKLWLYVDSAGRHWAPKAYAEMIARTTIREAEELATDQEMIALGEDLIEVSDHMRECWQCRPWEGVILSITGQTDGYITKAEARAHGLWHPRCGHKSLPKIVGLSIAAAARSAEAKEKQLAEVLQLRNKAKQKFLEEEAA